MIPSIDAALQNHKHHAKEVNGIRKRQKGRKEGRLQRKRRKREEGKGREAEKDRERENVEQLDCSVGH